jgi:hypothetical protein
VQLRCVELEPRAIRHGVSSGGGGGLHLRSADEAYEAGQVECELCEKAEEERLQSRRADAREDALEIRAATGEGEELEAGEGSARRERAR